MTDEQIALAELRAIREGNESLRMAIQAGFESLQEELRVTRESGNIPISVLERILEQNNKAYSSMHASTDATNKRVMGTLCYITTGLLVWFTGMKYFFPESLPAPVEAAFAATATNEP